MILQEELEQLENSLLEFYGYENERLAGLKSDYVQKPIELIKMEQVQALGIPLVEGGLSDQPHIWIYEYAICNRVKTMIMAARAQTNGENKEKDRSNL
jgi:hypothetical protein